MTRKPDPKLLAKAEAERKRNRADAHRALRLDDAPSPAETAALADLADDRWILHHAADYVDGTIRLLDQRGYLTTPELRRQECDAARKGHEVFNHVPVAEHRAAQQVDGRYIEALEKAVAALAGQLDTVGTLTAVQRSKTGQTAAEQAADIRQTVDGARRRWISGGEKRAA